MDTAIKRVFQQILLPDHRILLDIQSVNITLCKACHDLSLFAVNAVKSRGHDQGMVPGIYYRCQNIRQLLKFRQKIAVKRLFVAVELNIISLRGDGEIGVYRNLLQAACRLIFVKIRYSNEILSFFFIVVQETEKFRPILFIIALKITAGVGMEAFQ
jgi:hypothetical protein